MAPSSETALNSRSEDMLPTPSADRLTIYFSSSRVAPGAQSFDIWMSHRDRVDAPFSAPTLVDELNTSGNDYVSWLSADNCRIYGRGNSTGTNEIFMATRNP
jgi:hypothetical protein